MDLSKKQKEIVKELFNEGILVTPDIIEKINNGSTKEDILGVKNQTQSDENGTVLDVTNIFLTRFNILKEKIKSKIKKEIHSIKFINSLKNKTITTIGLIKSQRITTNGHTLLTIEDLSGETSVLINKNKENLNEKLNNLAIDGVIGFTGKTGDNIIFVDDIILPYTPLKELNKTKEEKNIVIISDLHLGNKGFYKKEFEKFIEWIKKSEKPISDLIITGDLIEGVGCYPGQEDDLEILDIKEQYKTLKNYLSQVPKSINIVIIPGNHDATRLAEPQKPIFSNFTDTLLDLPNIKNLPSPSYYKIDNLNLLLYHGQSFIYYAQNNTNIRKQGGMEKTDLIMELLLNNLHLSPTYGSFRHMMTYDEDPMIIRQVPDIFITGHIHMTTVTDYNNTTLINASSWVKESEYQKKQGLKPDPCKVIIINTKTREHEIIDFS